METENVEVIKAMVGIGLGQHHPVRRRLEGRARLRGRRLYRETGWVYLKSDHVPRAAQELIRVFDLMKERFGGGPPHS